MGKHTWLIVGGLVFGGLAIVYLMDAASTTRAPSGLTSSSNNGNFWGFLSNVVKTVDKAIPSWNKDPAEGKNFSDYPSTAIYGLDA